MSDRNDSNVTTLKFDPEYHNSSKLNETIQKFYETYDVMTGVRIAATLGGFFGLMVILVLYKSKSKTEKAMEDPDFTAAAVAEAEEEEERRLEAAVLEAAAYQQLNPRKARRSLDTASIPPGWVGGRTAARFSSIGGYSSLMEPPTRGGVGGGGGGGGVRLPTFIDDDEDSPPPPEDDCRSLYEDVYYNGHLDVPRRPSNITCSSSGSSYLERRDSSVAIGYLPAVSGRNNKTSSSSVRVTSDGNKRRQSSPLLGIYDFYYAIDIKVIQPTPGGSPCGSDRALHDVNPPVTPASPNLAPKLAPLASISSCNSSLGGTTTDCPESYDMSDSVFDGGDDDDGDDDETDDEIEPFSTDSETTTTAAEDDHRHHHRPDDEEDREKLTLKQSTPTPNNITMACSKSSMTLVENNPEGSSLNVGVSTAVKDGQQETLF